MKTYFEWHYDTLPPTIQILEVAVKLDDRKFTCRAFYKDKKWFAWDFPPGSRVYAWAYIPEPPPFDIDAA